MKDFSVCLLDHKPTKFTEQVDEEELSKLKTFGHMYLDYWSFCEDVYSQELRDLAKIAFEKDNCDFIILMENTALAINAVLNKITKVD